MGMSDKTHEIVNKFFAYVDADNKKLIEKYTLEEIRQARYRYKPDNLKLPSIALAMDDRINELEEINLIKIKKREKQLDRLFGFISGVVVAFVAAYLKGCLKSEK